MPLHTIVIETSAVVQVQFTVESDKNAKEVLDELLRQLRRSSIDSFEPMLEGIVPNYKDPNLQVVSLAECRTTEERR